jgi:hypothetical protein
MDKETIKILLDLLNPLHGSVDKQVMNQVTDERELDAPSDREYNVDITARMERDLTQAVCILESRLRDFNPPTGASTRDLLDMLLSRIDFDNMDPNTFTIAELRRAI